MAAFYLDEEQVWKCPKHPSKRRRSGICPSCLRDRLGNLCPDCANVRPCNCSSSNNNNNNHSSSASSSSSSSSSFLQRFSSVRESSSSNRSRSTTTTAGAGAGLVEGRVSNLIDSEPSFTRSRSVAIRFLRSRFADHKGDDLTGDSTTKSPVKSSPSFWSSVLSFKKHHHHHKSRNSDDDDDDSTKNIMMMRSKSVGVSLISSSSSSSSSRNRSDSLSKAGKGRWYFGSPATNKVSRQSKASTKVVQEQSPLCKASF